MQDHKEIETDSRRIMVSAIQHYSFCPRQYALIHIEQVFDENVYTIRGELAHERVDESVSRTEGGVRVERALPLWSDRLNLVGKADVVEFHDNGKIPYPVEYKLGKIKKRNRYHSDLQLCAQAMCLEEMLGVRVPGGAIYHISSRKRREVEFTDEMRERVEEIVKKIRTLMDSGTIPPPVNDGRCRDCSLKNACLPEAPARLEAIAKVEEILFNTSN